MPSVEIGKSGQARFNAGKSGRGGGNRGNRDRHDLRKSGHKEIGTGTI